MEPASVETRSGRGRCAVAAAELPAGTVLAQFSGRPYAACLLREEWPRRCACCFKVAAETRPLLRCSRCKLMRYCNAACQAADWPLHKHECAAMPRLADVAEAAAADLLLAGRCLWRRHDEPCGAAAQAFDELASAPVVDSDAALGAKAVSLGLVPPSATATHVAELVASFRANNFGVLDSLLAVVGAACHPSAALLNHSCAPNCVLHYAGTRLEVRTMSAVAAGEELCHSYVDLCSPTPERREKLRAAYGFRCGCRRCEDGLVHEGRRVDELMRGEADGASAAELEPPRALLRRAAAEEDLAREAALVNQALAVLRRRCDPCSLTRYQAEGTGLGLALAQGEVEAARECCQNAVCFLEAALSHCPRHPLLALQRFTLADLHEACGDACAAAAAMEACAQALEVTHGRGDELCQRALARLDELALKFC
jgi:SET and MYND domain-containing protein